MLICSWTHRGLTLRFSLALSGSHEPFSFFSSWCVNLIRVLLHDDTLH